MCRGSTRLYVHYLDIQYNNFLYVFLPLVGMRFWRHVPNSLRNKNMERHIPYLLLKMVFLAFKTLLSP
jgi:hypothetical protein